MYACKRISFKLDYRSFNKNDYVRYQSQFPKFLLKTKPKSPSLHVSTHKRIKVIFQSVPYLESDAFLAKPPFFLESSRHMCDIPPNQEKVHGGTVKAFIST